MSFDSCKNCCVFCLHVLAIYQFSKQISVGCRELFSMTFHGRPCLIINEVLFGFCSLLPLFSLQFQMNMVLATVVLQKPTALGTFVTFVPRESTILKCQMIEKFFFLYKNPRKLHYWIECFGPVSL